MSIETYDNREISICDKLYLTNNLPISYVKNFYITLNILEKIIVNLFEKFSKSGTDQDKLLIIYVSSLAILLSFVLDTDYYYTNTNFNEDEFLEYYNSQGKFFFQPEFVQYFNNIAEQAKIVKIIDQQGVITGNIEEQDGLWQWGSQNLPSLEQAAASVISAQKVNMEIYITEIIPTYFSELFNYYELFDKTTNNVNYNNIKKSHIITDNLIIFLQDKLKDINTQLYNLPVQGTQYINNPYGQGIMVGVGGLKRKSIRKLKTRRRNIRKLKTRRRNKK